MAVLIVLDLKYLRDKIMGLRRDSRAHSLSRRGKADRFPLHKAKPWHERQVRHFGINAPVWASSDRDSGKTKQWATTRMHSVSREISLRLTAGSGSPWPAIGPAG